MRPHLTASLLALLSTALFAFGAPDPGSYVGTLSVRRNYEGLSSTYTLRAQATVKPDGTIMILTSAPELPKAAVDLEAATTRAIPIPPGEQPQRAVGAIQHNYTIAGSCLRWSPPKAAVSSFTTQIRLLSPH